MKNYIGFVNDHSGSMGHLERAAIVDYNANIEAIKVASNRETMDTVVSVVGIGLSNNGQNGGKLEGVKRQVVVSNPHVLKPLTDWPTPGGTPLYDGIGDMVELFQSLPDTNNVDVSFLVVTTTDGAEGHSRKYTAQSIARLMQDLQATGRWTFVFRVPVGSAASITRLGVPAGNIQQWGTTEQGMRESTAATTKAVDTFYAARAAGAKSSNVFYASGATVDAAAVAAKLNDISKLVSLYQVPAHENGVEIRNFILTKRMAYLKGAAFYQLTKTESRVSETKLIAIRNRITGAIYSGAEARTLIGLPTSGNARVHPAGGGEFDIFIQSESTNRKLVANTGVLYWEAIGKPFLPTDEAYLQPKAVAPAKPAVVVLPAVPVTNKPTKSPIPVTKKAVVYPQPIRVPGSNRVRFHTPTSDAAYFSNRDDARSAAQMANKTQYDAGPTALSGKRWFVAN